MFVQANGKDFTIFWQHNPALQHQVGDGGTGTTLCMVFPGKVKLKERHGHQSAGMGSAWCSKKDQFCKSIGRKISLRRAIAGMEREHRKEIWEQVLAATKGRHSK